MRVFNIGAARAQLSRWVDLAASGESFVKAGKPLVKVTALQAPEASLIKRRGFLAGQLVVPDDFDRMGSPEIEQLFGGCE